jgi:glycosyltransferase involved in cell wall biosynthesis
LTLTTNTSSVAGQDFSKPLRLGMLSAHKESMCGDAMFSAGLADALTGIGADVSVVTSVDAALSLNDADVAVIQQGSGDGDAVVDLMDQLLVPTIVIAHTSSRYPARQHRSVLRAVAAAASQVVVVSHAAGRRLCADYAIDSRKVVMIPRGASVPANAKVRRDRPTIVTWGLLRRGKGIECAIEAMCSLRDVAGDPRYVVAGRTDPRELATDGEAYRDSLIEHARRCGVADSVQFDGRFRNGEMLSVLAQSATAIVLPYDSRDLAVSGVLVDAIANGRPVVATAFPHARELLSTGAGIVVEHGDPDALAAALRRVLTQPRLSGDMAAEARRIAPELAWPTVAGAYLRLAIRLAARSRAVER